MRGRAVSREGRTAAHLAGVWYNTIRGRMRGFIRGLINNSIRGFINNFISGHTRGSIRGRTRGSIRGRLTFHVAASITHRVPPITEVMRYRTFLFFRSCLPSTNMTTNARIGRAIAPS